MNEPTQTEQMQTEITIHNLQHEVQKAWLEGWEAAGDYPNKPPCQAKWLTSRARAIYQGEKPCFH